MIGGPIYQPWPRTLIYFHGSSLEVARWSSKEIPQRDHAAMRFQDNLAITLDHLGRHDEALDLKKEVLKRRALENRGPGPGDVGCVRFGLSSADVHCFPNLTCTRAMYCI